LCARGSICLLAMDLKTDDVAFSAGCDELGSRLRLTHPVPFWAFGAGLTV